MTKSSWWGTDGRLHIPVDAVVEPSVSASSSDEAGYQAYRRGVLDERAKLGGSQRSEGGGGFFRLLGILLAVFLAAAGIYYLAVAHGLDEGWTLTWPTVVIPVPAKGADRTDCADVEAIGATCRSPMPRQ